MYHNIKHDNGKNDSLNLSNNNYIKLLIEKEGLANERIIFSSEVIKLNAKGKKQARILMITTKAIYNLKKKKSKQSQRRVCIRDIGMMTLSALSPEFAIHVPSEYDYHFISKKKDEIAETLQEIYFKVTMSKLLVVYSELRHLKDIILTKKLAKFESRNSKHQMQETITSMKDVLKQIDENQYEENESENEKDNADMEQYGIVYSPACDDYENDENDEVNVNENNNNNNNNYNSNVVTEKENNVAVYQSIVYGNDQLLMQQNNKILQQSNIHV